MEESSKKRKRSSETSGKPKKKKVAVQEPPKPPAPQPKSVIKNLGKYAPVFANSPGIQLKPSLVFEAETKTRKRPDKFMQNKNIAEQEITLQSKDHPTIDYVGREPQRGDPERLYKHYMVVVDKVKGTATWIEARQVNIKGTVRAQEAPPEAMRERTGHMTGRDMRNDLGQTFGTKKAKKAIASITENAISPQKASQTANSETSTPKLSRINEAILETMKDGISGMASRDELETAADEAKPRPKANLDAESPVDVYPVKELIGLDILKSLPVKEWKEKTENDKDVVTSSRFVARRLKRVVNDGGIQNLRVLRYYLALLDFYKASKPKGRATRVVPKREDLQKALPGLPQTVIDGIRLKFSNQGQIGKFQTDLIITTLCVLALTVDNFVVDTLDIREDLNLETKDMSTYFHEIGAHVALPSESERLKQRLDKAVAAQRRIAKLRIPLEFPKSRFPRRR